MPKKKKNCPVHSCTLFSAILHPNCVLFLFYFIFKVSSFYSTIFCVCQSPMEIRSALTRVPLDVFEHHVLPHLSFSNLVACQLACSFLHKACMRRSSRNQKPNQIQVTKDIYKNGYVNLLDWFHAVLKYPSLISSSVTGACVELAVEGIFLPFQSLNFIIIIFLQKHRTAYFNVCKFLLRI